MLQVKLYVYNGVYKYYLTLPEGRKYPSHTQNKFKHKNQKIKEKRVKKKKEKFKTRQSYSTCHTNYGAQAVCRTHMRT